MTYRNVIRFPPMGATVTANASASISKSEDVSKECKEAGVAFTKAATYAGLTSDAVTKTVTQCCQAVKDSKASGGERTRILAECFARAAAAAGAAAACIAGGITAPFAGVCGTVGAFVADRVMGYSKNQLAAGTAASIVCAAASGGTSGTACFYAAAEVVGWVGDKLGPALEGIFSPGAANRRELAKRRADSLLYFGSVEKVREAQEDVYEQWTASVNRIGDLFIAAFPSSYYALARSKLGFGNDYHSIALAFLNHGIPMTILPSSKITECQGGKVCRLCENFARQNLWGTTLSPVCPPDLVQKFYAVVNASGAKSTSQIASQAAAELLPIANSFFFQLPLAEAAIAARLSVVAIAVKQQQALDEAAQSSRANLATKTEAAAGVAVAAADAALKGSAEEGRKAVARARNRYDVALAAYNLLLDGYGKRTSQAEAAVVAIACAKDVDCKRAGAAVERAKKAADLAAKNAASATAKRYLLGAGAAVAIAGGVYLFTRK